MLTGMFGWRMTFNFFRLVVLFTTPALRRAGVALARLPLSRLPAFRLALALALALLSAANGARAATDAFDGGQVTGCKRANTTYTCDTLSQANDITIASGYTVVVGTDVAFTYFQVLKMSGSAVLRATGDLDLRGLQTANTQVAGGTLRASDAFLLGANDQTVTANIVAATITTGGPSTRINGNVTLSGDANLGSSTTITGTLSAATVTAGASLRIDGGIAASGTINLSSSSTIKGGITGIAGVNGGRSGAVTTGSGSTLTGNIVASAFTLASGSTLAGDINAPTVELSAANAIVTGNITATTSLVVGSGASVTGKIDSPKVDLNASGVTIKGDINAGTSLTIGSGNTVNGNLTGTTLTIAASNVIVNGNVTMKGDVDIGSGATINGDLSARNVTTHASGDNINGNASVNAIFLDYGATVGKTITCTGPGAVGCSCVTKADSNYQPSCGAPPASQAHHIQISHGGSALTCQPEPVTLTACANAACTAPHYNGATQVTLQPGGGVFTISGGTNNAASVRQTTAGTAILSASGGANATTCVNSANGAAPCQMVFKDEGLSISAPDHVAMTDASVMVQASKSVNGGKSCVPLVANQTVNINFSCTYSNPTAAKAAKVPLWLRDKNAASAIAVACGGAGAGVPLAFDANGAAVANLQYAEVGTVALMAAYSAGGLGASTFDSAAFTAAPAGFTLSAQRVATAPTLAAGVFAKASEPFTLTVKAVNKKGDVTTNFGKELTPENIKIEPVVIEPVVIAPAIAAGKLSDPTQPIVNGVATDTYTFDETGTVKLTARLERLSGYYMNNASTGFKTTGETASLRFIPDHFDTVLMTKTEIDALPASRPDARVMSCANLAAINRPCPDAAGSFINAGQPFLVKVLAYTGPGASAALSKNYTGASARPITLTAVTAAGVPTATVLWSGTALPRYGFSAGVGMLADPVGNLPKVDLGAVYPNKVAPVTVALRASDSEDATSNRGAVSVEAPLTVVSGRLALGNSFGAPGAAQPVGAAAEYYMGANVGWVFNPQMKVSAPLSATAAVFSKCDKGLNTAQCGSMRVAMPPNQLDIVNGSGTFRVTPPNPAPTTIGTAEVSLGTLIPYLPSGQGHLTFGIYRSGPVIYRREVY
jgi:MSHA biogenesis protein MshQ